MAATCRAFHARLPETCTRRDRRFGGWPKLGTTDFTAAYHQADFDKPDLLFAAVWGGDYVAFYKQALRYGLFDKMKVATTLAFGGQPHAIGKDHPEGVLAGCHANYLLHFPGQGRWPINDSFVERYFKRWNEYPSFEADGAYTSLYLLKAAIEKANLLAGGGRRTTPSSPCSKAWVSMRRRATPISGPTTPYKDTVIGMTKNDPKYAFPVWDPKSIITIPIRNITAPPNWPKPGTSTINRRRQPIG